MYNFSKSNLKRLSGSAGLAVLLSLSAANVMPSQPAKAQDAGKSERRPSVETLVKTITEGNNAENLGLLEKMANEGNSKAAAAVGELYGEGKFTSKNLEKALNFYKIAYDGGEISVAGKLGDLHYRNSDVLKIDPKQAIEFYTKSSEAGNAWAMSSLGDIYREGKIATVDLSKALALYNRALEKGNASVITKLGDLYYRNADSLGLDQAKALEYYQKGAEEGNSWAMASLGDVYREGKIVTSDLPKAMELYVKALDKGNTSVVTKLGDLYYRNSEQLGLDPSKALVYYQQGSEEGNPWAMASLGDVYREGKIVPENLKEAFDLYSEAFAKGNTSVATKLGDLYYRKSVALGLEQAKALEYYQLAANDGNAWAIANLGDVYREGKIVPKDIEKSFTLYNEALEKGNTSVGIKLGDLYYRNADALGLAPEKALEYYTKGAEEGSPWAIASLGDVYRDGLIAPKDLAKAFALYNEAFEKGNVSVAGRLGNLYYRNSDELKLDQAKAISYLEQGADAGDAWAMSSLADVYREGKIAPVDMAKASDLYEKSYAGGNQGAYVAQASMLLRGTTAQQKRGLAMVGTGLKQDIPGMIPVWAEANLFGRGMARNPQKALQILKSGAASGDIPATFRLAALYIQGYGSAIPRNATAASKLLAGLKGKAESARIESEQLYMMGAFAASKKQLDSFMTRLRDLSPDTQASMVSRISWANHNTFVYVLQDYLKARGIYKGPVNGQLTSSTTAAMNTACKQLAANENICSNGPLSEQVRPLLSDYLKQGNIEG